MSHIKFNLAQLLRQKIGAQREYSFTEQALHLDDTLVLRDIHGTVRFTRTASGVFAHIRTSGYVQLTCVRSLEPFVYPISLDVADEFHAIVDVVAGVALAKPTEEDPFLLDELHMADIGEAIREYTLIELPINPVCEAYRDQPLRYTIEFVADQPAQDISSTGMPVEELGRVKHVQADDGDEEIDKRLEVLKNWKQSEGS